MEQALSLAENNSSKARGGEVSGEFEALLKHIRQRAAFHFLKNGDLDRAKGCFVQGDIDVREVKGKRVKDIPRIHSHNL